MTTITFLQSFSVQKLKGKKYLKNDTRTLLQSLAICKIKIKNVKELNIGTVLQSLSVHKLKVKKCLKNDYWNSFAKSSGSQNKS